MRHLATLLLLPLGAYALLGPTPSHASEESLLFDYVGFDYESPNPDPNTFGENGSGYVTLGAVPFLFTPLVSDQTTNEYTYVITGLTQTGIASYPGFSVVTYGPGTVTIYEDSRNTGTAFDYGENPPNATAPSTFNDGTAIMVGTLTDFTIVVASDGTGSFDGTLEVTGGTQIGNFPVNQRTGWTFAGGTENSLQVPPGYIHQIDGQAFLNKPVPTIRSSWGRLKASYR